MTETTFTRDMERTFRRRWWLANVAGYFVGHLAFSLIGHGITGPHGDVLTWAEYAAHTAGMLAAAGVVFALQRPVLRPHIAVTNIRIALGTAALVAGFWLGAETVGPPADYLLSLTILGSALWIGATGWRRTRWLWNLAGVVSFPIGLAAAIFVVRSAIESGVFDPESPSLLHHTIGWLLGATTTALVGAYLSGWPLAHLLVRGATAPVRQAGLRDSSTPGS